MYFDGLRVFNGANAGTNIVYVFQTVQRTSPVHAYGRMVIIQGHLAHFDGGMGRVNRGQLLTVTLHHLLVIHGKSSNRLQRTVRQQDAIVRGERQFLGGRQNRIHRPYIYEAAAAGKFHQRARRIFRGPFRTPPTAVQRRHAEHVAAAVL